MNDIEFEQELTNYLRQFSEGHEPAVPLFYRQDGSINREKTLALPCYGGARSVLEGDVNL